MNLRRFLFILLLVCLACGPPAIAQDSSSGPFVITANSQCFGTSVTGRATVVMYVSGTFSMTIQPSVAILGQAAANKQVTPSTSTTAQSTITAVGNYRADVAGQDLFQLCSTAYTSGTATIYFKVTGNISTDLIGSAAGGSSVTSVTGTSNQIDSTGGSTPVISLDAAITLPGNLTAPTGSTITTSGTGVNNANQINGTALSGLATGILKNTTTTGVPSIAVAGDFPTLNQNTTGSAAKWTTARNLAGNSVDGSANVPFANAFIVQGTTDAGLSGAQFLGALGTGLVKNTTTTGVLSIGGSADILAACTTCVTSAASLTSTALMTGAGAQASQTPSAASTLSAGGNMALAGTLSATQLTSTIAIGTAPLVVTSTTNVPNLNASSLGGKTAVGTDAGLATAATVSTTALNSICSTANGGVSTTNCPGPIPYALDSGSANAVVITVQGLPSSITTGSCASFKAAASSTGASTINVTPFTGATAYGAIALDKRTTGGVAALGASGDIITGGMYGACYDGTEWVLTTPSSTLYTGGSNAAGNVMLGNANNQLTSSTNLVITSNVWSKYNSLATTGNGMSSVQASPSVIVIGSGTSIGNTSLCSTTLCPAGTYTVHAYLDLTTACGTTGTYAVNLLWTDDQAAKTAVINFNGTGAVPATGLVTTTTVSNFGQDAFVLRTTGAANNALGSINYSTTAVACGTAGPMVGNLYLSVTREQ